MAVEIVQTLQDGTARYKQTTLLDGVSFVLNFDWNARDEYWYLSIHDSEDNPIASCIGMRLVVGWPILKGVTDDNRPAGELMLIGPNESLPDLEGLGGDHFLVYIPEADVANV